MEKDRRNEWNWEVARVGLELAHALSGETWAMLGHFIFTDPLEDNQPCNQNGTDFEKLENWQEEYGHNYGERVRQWALGVPAK